MKRMLPIIALGASTATSGCINVTAPDKPIEINLNINVTQEVVYRLDGEAKTLIQQNPGIF
ncbi:YnbE family lipoprotein [Sphingomonas sp. QA11]|uniref:YnbE family lipoprotein n=1 Tax=Sphingomonas sp. QA11 TaxID=2950605 RepID=UPI002348EEB6|nr:YnbE family lipoprotein [Sphingomonas sp. QA11]WCM28121.1 YnbE family lipoprotein [Sphingomonas sp. QA11]